MNVGQERIIDVLISGYATTGDTKLPAVIIGSKEFGILNTRMARNVKHLQSIGYVKVFANPRINQEGRTAYVSLYVVAKRDARQFAKLGWTEMFVHSSLRCGEA